MRIEEGIMRIRRGARIRRRRGRRRRSNEGWKHSDANAVGWITLQNAWSKRGGGFGVLLMGGKGVLNWIV